MLGRYRGILNRVRPIIAIWSYQVFEGSARGWQKGFCCGFGADQLIHCRGVLFG